MPDHLALGSPTYLALLGLLVIARAMDFLSTWIATPNLVLEGNPIARRLGWRYGLPLNLVVCLGFAAWPVPAIIITTTSLLVAARNFQSAWLMRTMGEEAYRDWHVHHIRVGSVTLLVACLAGQTMLLAVVGLGLVYFSAADNIPWAIGIGIIAYAAAVAVYSGLALWRIRREGPVLPVDSSVRKPDALGLPEIAQPRND